MTLYLEKRHVDEMIAHSREDAPRECCGILIGKGSRVSEARRADNTLHSPVLYRIDDKQLLAAIREAEKNGTEIVGFYHSHTATEAYPSPTDRRQAMAAWPDVFYVLVSLRDERNPALRAFVIDDRGEISEHTVQIEG
ncbi:MAG: M67 family metallopeptidase [Chloroflexota bacterium]